MTAEIEVVPGLGAETLRDAGHKMPTLRGNRKGAGRERMSEPAVFTWP